MNATDPRIDAYIANSAEFARPILARLRAAVQTVCPQVEETLKWGAPSFVYRGRILCFMAAFKQHASFGFWQHAQVMGAGVERDGMGSFGRMRSLKDVPGRTLLAPLLRKAMALIDAGVPAGAARKASAPKSELAVPAELLAELKRHPVARRTFDGFSPSHRREYIEWIVEAKREETRLRRLGQTIEWLSEGKPRHWKHLRG